MHVNLEHEDIKDVNYNVKTSNAFELLGEPSIDASKVKESVLDKLDSKPTKIDFENYQEAFEDFITNFKEDPSETPKYLTVATEMMKNNFNMFHVKLKDIRKYNPNLGGFVAEQYLKISEILRKILKNYIENRKLGALNHDLYFNLIE